MTEWGTLPGKTVAINFISTLSVESRFKGAVGSAEFARAASIGREREREIVTSYYRKMENPESQINEE